mmetsp:Transcript_26938/g.68405  ORF Transcript_26938/g.68405 Transcript_26938/m.68405 type:complete len:257 (+) Transcript_26938:443-1213(+)
MLGQRIPLLSGGAEPPGREGAQVRCVVGVLRGAEQHAPGGVLLEGLVQEREPLREALGELCLPPRPGQGHALVDGLLGLGDLPPDRLGLGGHDAPHVEEGVVRDAQRRLVLDMVLHLRRGVLPPALGRRPHLGPHPHVALQVLLCRLFAPLCLHGALGALRLVLAPLLGPQRGGGGVVAPLDGGAEGPVLQAHQVVPPPPPVEAGEEPGAQGDEEVLKLHVRVVDAPAGPPAPPRRVHRLAHDGLELPQLHTPFAA